MPYCSYMFYGLKTSWPIPVLCSEISDAALNSNFAVVHSRNCTSTAYSACNFNATHD